MGSLHASLNVTDGGKHRQCKNSIPSTNTVCGRGYTKLFMVKDETLNILLSKLQAYKLHPKPISQLLDAFV